MNSTELLEAFRSDVVDLEAPTLWSDAEIYRYMDDAQKMFCRFTEGIEDARTPAVTQLVVAPNEEWLDHSPLILKIRVARRTDTGAKLPIVPFEKAADHGIRFDGRAGPVQALVIGEEQNAFHLYPTPNEPVTIALSVFRLPLKAITDAGDQKLELDEQHHESLLMWMKHKAYLKQDADAFDPRRAEDSRSDFMAYCAQAKREQGRARHPAGAVVYGGY